MEKKRKKLYWFNRMQICFDPVA